MKKVILMALLLLVLTIGIVFNAQYQFGIQIPKVNPVTGDTCGIVIYHNSVLNFSSWDPHKIRGYLNPDEIPDRYSVGQTWGGIYTNPDGTTSFGFGFLDGYCHVQSGEVFYIGEFMHSLPKEPRYRLPFVLP